jgi:hypothetical protein
MCYSQYQNVFDAIWKAVERARASTMVVAGRTLRIVETRSRVVPAVGIESKYVTNINRA